MNFKLYVLAMAVLMASGLSLVWGQKGSGDQAKGYRLLLNKPVSVSISHGAGDSRLSVQFGVIEICEAAGIPYQWGRSQSDTGGKCLTFIEPIKVKDVMAAKAIGDVLKVVGLTFEIDDKGLYLLDPTKQSTGVVELVKDIPKLSERDYVKSDPPSGLTPRMDLSPADYQENFEILWEAIDENYSFFEHKEIDWQAVKKEYQPQVEGLKSAEGFYELMERLVRELQDCHSWLNNYKVNVLERFAPSVKIARIEGKAVVVDVTEGSEAFEKGIRRGAVITNVDGLGIEENFETLRPYMIYSSNRHFLHSASSRLLDGPEETSVVMTFILPGAKDSQQVKLKRERWREGVEFEPGFSGKCSRFYADFIFSVGDLVCLPLL